MEPSVQIDVPLQRNSKSWCYFKDLLKRNLFKLNSNFVLKNFLIYYLQQTLSNKEIERCIL